MLNAFEIVALLGGTNAAARFFGISPPSVSEWVKKGVIPEDKLVRKAAALERQLPGFSRQAQWPDTFQEIWPELRAPCAPSHAPDKPFELVDRRVAELPIPFEDRRGRPAAEGGA